MAKRYSQLKPGEVGFEHDRDPPISSLVDAFQGHEASAADAIVLRGYLGRSDILVRTGDYLDRARSERLVDLADEARAAGLVTYKAQELAGLFEQPRANTKERAANLIAGNSSLAIEAARDLLNASVPVNDVMVLNELIQKVEAAKTNAQVDRQIPWRLYLTPRLDRYVDFHRSSLLAYRREAKSERQDACTVWLRIFQEGRRDPIPYRIVHETTLGPSFATWLGGQTVDDYAEDSSSGSAWGGPSGVYGGFRQGTGKACLDS